MRRRRSADPLLAAVFSAAGILRPDIAYIGAASHDDPDFLAWLTAWFRRAGAGSVQLAPLAAADADRRRAVAVLERADMVFISGGDVDAGMDVLRRRGIVARLGELFRAGKPFFGLSAGSIMLAGGWLRWRDPNDDSSAEPFACLGLARLLCDTHAEEDDWSELKALLALGSAAPGYGIPAGAALRVDSDGTLTALGKPVERFRRRGGNIVREAPLAPPES